MLRFCESLRWSSEAVLRVDRSGDRRWRWTGLLGTLRSGSRLPDVERLCYTRGSGHRRERPRVQRSEIDHEAYLPAQVATPQATPRFPRADEHPGGPGGSRPPPPQGSPSVDGLKRWASRAHGACGPAGGSGRWSAGGVRPPVGSGVCTRSRPRLGRASGGVSVAPGRWVRRSGGIASGDACKNCAGGWRPNCGATGIWFFGPGQRSPRRHRRTWQPRWGRS